MEHAMQDATDWRQLSPAKRKQLEKAVEQTRLAYQFIEANSYTHSALAACLAAATFTEPDWIDEYLDWVVRP
jgi:hypothetical protein